jgi:hypothetical protein
MSASGFRPQEAPRSTVDRDPPVAVTSAPLWSRAAARYHLDATSATTSLSRPLPTSPDRQIESDPGCRLHERTPISISSPTGLLGDAVELNPRGDRPGRSPAPRVQASPSRPESHQIRPNPIDSDLEPKAYGLGPATVCAVRPRRVAGLPGGRSGWKNGGPGCERQPRSGRVAVSGASTGARLGLRGTARQSLLHSGARQLSIQHLSVRLPWHDTGWAGSDTQPPAVATWERITLTGPTTLSYSDRSRPCGAGRRQRS